MPQLSEERINTQTLWGLWEITESSAELESRVELSRHETELLSGFRNETRRLHWLSYRILIRTLLGCKEISVSYNDAGKPFMINPSGYISVTHSGKFSAVIYSEKSPVGIDIEKIQERIEKVAHKYLSDEEIEKVSSTNRVLHLVTLWAAKEALYKLFGRKEVDFIEHLYVEPFSPSFQGTFFGYIKIDNIKDKYLMHYQQVEEYMLVWVEGKV